MSTRSQIQHEDYPNIYLYRHSDGYPYGEHGVLASLLPFLRWFDKERGIGEGDYCLARCLEHMIRDTNQEKRALSYGIDDAQHGDIEFLYTINKDKTVTIKHLEWNFEDDTDAIRFEHKISIEVDVPNDEHELILLSKLCELEAKAERLKNEVACAGVTKFFNEGDES